VSRLWISSPAMAARSSGGRRSASRRTSREFMNRDYHVG
jgi:hypothetical protein